MPIVSSGFTVGHQQRDGRMYIQEQHTDNVGIVHFVEYLGSLGQTDAERMNIMNARALQIDEQLKAQEVLDCISLDRLTTVYIDKTMLASRIRELYRNGEMVFLVRIARWIRRRIVAGGFTEDQVRNAFGLTQAQWDALKAKMMAMDDCLGTVETARGE